MERSRSHIWEFAETCERARTAGQIADAFLKQADKLGFGFVGIGSQADPMSPPAAAVMIRRMPEAWIAHYSEQRYHEIDPIHIAGKRRSMPFHWDTPAFQTGLSAIQMRMLNELREAGLVGGVAIPIRSPGALPATCALYPGANHVEPAAYMIAHSMAVLAHEAIRTLAGAQIASAPRLSMRERASLVLVARGKSDWAISTLLGVSEAAAHRLVESAKRKLGVATRVQAVVRAVYVGEIPAEEVI